MPDRLIGLISDTHGLVRPHIHEALSGVGLILHAGDVGGSEIVRELELIAPVRAVYGNTDIPGDPELTAEHVDEFDGITVHLSHGHELGSPTPAALLGLYPHDVLVYGHTHRALVVHAEGRLVVNPGSAGPARFEVRPSVGLLRIRNRTASAELIELPGRV